MAGSHDTDPNSANNVPSRQDTPGKELEGTQRDTKIQS
jgi:hypothetical protein